MRYQGEGAGKRSISVMKKQNRLIENKTLSRKSKPPSNGCPGGTPLTLRDTAHAVSTSSPGAPGGFDQAQQDAAAQLGCSDRRRHCSCPKPAKRWNCPSAARLGAAIRHQVTSLHARPAAASRRACLGRMMQPSRFQPRLSAPIGQTMPFVFAIWPRASRAASAAAPQTETATRCSEQSRAVGWAPAPVVRPWRPPARVLSRVVTRSNPSL